jgi:aminopeptidase N
MAGFTARLAFAVCLAISGVPNCWAQIVDAPASAKDAPAKDAPSLDLPLGRLPSTVAPREYRLDLTIDPARTRFSGKVEIDARLGQPAARIFLHGRDLAMHRAAAIVSGKRYEGTWKQQDPSGVASLTFAAPLPAGPVTFAFEYDAAFNDAPAGLFRVKVDEAWYVWSQFQSIDARAAFPGFDEPGFKTPFAVTMRTPPGMLAVSNAPQSSEEREGGLVVHRFAPTLPLPTYLVAMMTGPFAAVSGEVPPGPHREKPLPLRVISPRPNADRLEFALQGSKDIVLRLEDYFGDGFPYPKLDQITSPIMPGAMENAGADLYGDNIIVMDRTASVGRQRSFGMVVSHELAHQWFGDLVTPAWWDDIWLNESFANWMGYRIGDQWRPDLKIASGSLAEGFDAMNIDALVAGRPIRQKIERNSQINGSFDSITYGKGGHVVAMIAGYLGDEKFRTGVRSYMSRHRYGNATSDQFFAAMADAAGDPRLLGAMRSFVDQQGVPLLTFTRKGRGYTVTQSRFAALGTKPGPERWIVPFCARRGIARHCQLIDGQGADFNLDGKGPLMPNADGLGYYRFELPPLDWDMLISQADRLPGGEALALADSLRASFLAGRASTEQLLALARKLVRNPDSHAFSAAGSLLDALTRGDLLAASAMPAYRQLVGKLYKPVLRKLGFDPRTAAYANEDPELSQRRASAADWTVNWNRDRALRKQLGDAARAYLAGDSRALDSQWFDLAFDVYLDAGGLPAAKDLGERALTSQDPDLRPALLDALASSGSVAIATWLLDEWKDPRLRRSERQSFLRTIMAVRGTREMGYRWMKAHLDELTTDDGGIFFTNNLPQNLGRYCSVEKAGELQRELQPRFAGKAGELELDRVIEKIRNCGLVRTAIAPTVSAVLLGD